MAITGVAYPLAVGLDGNLTTATDADLIATHIRSLLETEPGESPMRPEYGTPNALFESQQNFAAYASDVQRRLIATIPQAQFSVSGTLGDEGVAILTINWSFNSSEQTPIIAEI